MIQVITLTLYVLSFGPDSTLSQLPQELTTVDLVKELEEKHDAAAKKGNRREVSEEYLLQFQALATKHAGTEVGLQAELWILRNHWWKRAEGTMESTSIDHANQLIGTYPNSPQLAQIAQFSYLFGKTGLRPVMEKLVETSPHDIVDAAAYHALAGRLRRSKETEDLELANKYLTLLINKYGALAFRDTTYGAIATAMRSPHSKDSLEVGQPAPEITGETVHGTAMKLSDFRGKIVLLDFWGDW